MCFSATASFVTGGALSIVGVATIKRAKTKTSIPFASIPLLFGIQQIIEGVLWLSFSSPILNTATTYAYAIFSQTLWPIFIPLSILLIEKDIEIKKILRQILAVGVVAGAYLFYFLMTDGITSQMINDSIAYHSPILYLPLTLILYFIATCGSSLVSSNKIINIFGVVLAISFFITGWFFVETFVSVWCFSAALLSVIIHFYFQASE